MKIYTEYEINRETYALLAHTNDNGKIITRVIERNDEFYINQTPTEIIKRSCRYFGSSFEGRLEGTRTLIGVSHKAPIIVEEGLPIIVFPTSSPRLNDCSWISNQYVKKVNNDNFKTFLSFKNGNTIELDISSGSLDNQILRASRLTLVLLERKTSIRTQI